MIGVHPWQLALFDDRAQEELWSADPTTMHSSSYNPTGKAERVDGGYKVWGRWSFSSGCDHCRGVNLGAFVPGGEIPEFRSVLLLADQYRIEDTWHVAGLKGTGSKDIVVETAFVPEYRSQSHVDYALGAPLPGQEHNDGPLYRLPWSVVFNMALAASILGSARGFIDTWIMEARDRMVVGTGRLADDPLTHRRLAETRWDLDTAITVMRTDAQLMWDMAEERRTPTMEDRARVRWNINRGCERVADACTGLLRAASGRTVFLDHPLQARFQDLEAGLGHAFLGPDPLAKAVGGSLLGTSKPEFVLRPVLRVDTHRHVVPPEYADWLRSKGVAAGGLPIPSWEPEAALAVMDRHDIATAVLSVSTPGARLGNDAEARARARDVNDYAAQMVRDHAGRFGFLATLPLPDVDGALAEIDRAIDMLGADGVVFLANYRGTYLGDHRLDPVFDELQRRRRAFSRASRPETRSRSHGLVSRTFRPPQPRRDLHSPHARRTAR